MHSARSSKSKRSHRSQREEDAAKQAQVSPSKSPSRSISKIKAKSHSIVNGGDDLVVVRRRSSILTTLNANEETLALMEERKLLNLQRDELEREMEKFSFMKKKHEAEVYAVKTEYIEQTKRLKKQYSIYKASCERLMSELDDESVDMFDIKWHKLETKEKVLKDSQKSVDKQHKTAQILFQTSTNLLQRVQDATMKLEVYAKLCDEKCDAERDLIKKQETDRKRYLLRMNKLRDEMLSAPWLILSDKLDPAHNHGDAATSDGVELRKLHQQLIKTYQAIREERRKFLPVQRKWAKLIAKHQVYHHDEKAFLSIRMKLQNMRKYEKEYKMKVFEEMKAMLNGTQMDEKRLQLKEREITLDHRAHLLEDRERQVRNEKKLLRLQQRNLEESMLELEYERELVSAQKCRLHSQLNKERLYDISSQIGANSAKLSPLQIGGTASKPGGISHRASIDSLETCTLGIDTETQMIGMKQELQDKEREVEELRRKLQHAEHTNDKLQLKVDHFEESMKKEHDEKNKQEQSYEKFTMAMETLTRQFEQMVVIKDQEISKMKTSMEEWRNKADELQRENDAWSKEKAQLNESLEELRKQNEMLISRNEQLEYTVPQLTLENEQLREQIQDMIITNDEALQQHQQLGHQKRERCQVSTMNAALEHSDESSPVSDNEERLPLKPKHSQAVIDKNMKQMLDEEESMNDKLKTPRLRDSDSDVDHKRKANSRSGDADNEHHKNGNVDSSQTQSVENSDSKTDASNSNLNLLAIEESSATITSIKSQLAASDANGRLLTKHESNDSMQSIVDMVRKTKLQSQTLNLEILKDHSLPDEDDEDDEHLLEEDDDNMLSNDTSFLSESAEDSFNDHLGMIEDMLNGNTLGAVDEDDVEQKQSNNTVPKMDDEEEENKLLEEDLDSMDEYFSMKEKHSTKHQRKQKPKKKKKTRNNPKASLMHSNTDEATQSDSKTSRFLATPNGCNNERDSVADTSSSDDSDHEQDPHEEPPLFWDIDADRDKSHVQKLIDDPNDILNECMSPTQDALRSAIINDTSLSDWDKSSADSDSNAKEVVPVKAKPIKKKRKKSVKLNVSNTHRKKRNSKELDRDEVSTVTAK